VTGGAPDSGPGVQPPFVRTVQGDRVPVQQGIVYMHEHLIIDSPLIADRFPHIHLWDVDAAVDEVRASAAAGVALMVDAMPCASGRDARRLSQISERTGVQIIASTGLHHDRYYGALHWSNRVGVDELADLFVADLLEGIDEFDYTSPVVRRTTARAGIVKVATSGEIPDARDRRNLEAAAMASIRSGAPILTHCEGGRGGSAQVEILTGFGVPAGAITLSHIDKVGDPRYLRDLAETGVNLEFDQILKHHAQGAAAVQALVDLVAAGHGDRIVVGTDGARRSLWAVHGGAPGLAWLAATLPSLLRTAGLSPDAIDGILRGNAVRALSWRAAA
jgi:predicted metal-dependent phosphotriesterase family hydrolase